MPLAFTQEDFLVLHAFVLSIGIKEKKRQNHENDYAYVILLANSNILEILIFSFLSVKM